MATSTSLDRIGVGIDTARYGHRVSFLRADRQRAAKPLTVMESQAGYQALQDRLEHLRQLHPQVHFHIRIDAAGQYAGHRQLITIPGIGEATAAVLVAKIVDIEPNNCPCRPPRNRLASTTKPRATNGIIPPKKWSPRLPPT